MPFTRLGLAPEVLRGVRAAGYAEPTPIQVQAIPQILAGRDYTFIGKYNGKTAILLAYPGEGHGLRGIANRKDLTIRYFEFFDHYLKGAPAPKWMTDGVPFLKKNEKTSPTTN